MTKKGKGWMILIYKGITVSEVIIYTKEGAITNRPALKKFFDELLKFSKGDGKFLITGKNAKKRSVQLNRYYWGGVVPLVKDGLRNMGYDEVKTDSDAHEVMKHLFLKKEIRSRIDDNAIIIAGSTADLTNTEFIVYIEDIIKWGSEYLGIQIFYPNEQSIMFAEYDNEVKATIIE